ncbi:hypothetical protein FRC03_005216 [Tulasnella sp. 419]|nr:hypothetical protein FRC03_005216 [Tulasnella sp. 419]
MEWNPYFYRLTRFNREGESRQTTEEPQAPLASTEQTAFDFTVVGKPQPDEYSVEDRLARHGIVCPEGWRPDMVHPEPAYSYIQYTKPLLTIKLRKESRRFPELHNIGPRLRILLQCVQKLIRYLLTPSVIADALAEQVQNGFPVEDAPSPSTSCPPIPPRPEWKTPANSTRPATFAPLQPLNGLAGIGPYRGPRSRLSEDPSVSMK